MMACGIALSTLPPGHQLARRVETVFSAANVAFNKITICKRIAAEIRQMKSASDLPEETRRMAQELFDCVGKAFGR